MYISEVAVEAKEGRQEIYILGGSFSCISNQFILGGRLNFNFKPVHTQYHSDAR